MLTVIIPTTNTERIPADQRTSAISIRKRPAVYRNILIKSKPRQGASTRDTLTTAKARITTLKNASNSTLSTIKETIIMNLT
jgi:hypothetical protein